MPKVMFDWKRSRYFHWKSQFPLQHVELPKFRIVLAELPGALAATKSLKA